MSQTDNFPDITPQEHGKDHGIGQTIFECVVGRFGSIQIPGFQGTQNHGIGTGLILSFPGILSDQQNIDKPAVETADPKLIGAGEGKLGKNFQNTAVFCAFGGCVIDLLQIAAEQKSDTQHGCENQSQQGTQKLHGFPGKGIFAFHIVTEILL